MANGIGDCVACLEASITGDTANAVTRHDRLLILHASFLIQGTGYCHAHARRLVEEGVVRKLMREQRR